MVVRGEKGRAEEEDPYRMMRGRTPRDRQVKVPEIKFERQDMQLRERDSAMEAAGDKRGDVSQGATRPIAAAPKAQNGDPGPQLSFTGHPFHLTRAYWASAVGTTIPST